MLEHENTFDAVSVKFLPIIKTSKKEVPLNGVEIEIDFAGYWIENGCLNTEEGDCR